MRAIRFPHPKSPFLFSMLIFAMLQPGARVHAVINAALQPLDLAERYHQVLDVTVLRVDQGAQTGIFRVDAVIQGDYTPVEIRVSLREGGQVAGLLSLANQQRLVVYHSGRIRGQRDQMLIYVGSGKWYIARTDPNDPAHWLWERDADHGVEATSMEIMFATFNGEVGRLAEMMRDLQDGSYYFPARPFTRFHDPIVIGTLDAAIHGVALYDITGNGMLDIFATSPAGARFYAQTEKEVFEDQTATRGLAGLTSRSVSVADIEGNGRADLLVDAAIFLQQENGHFMRTDLLPGAGGLEILSGAFVEINGDGYPDIVLSLAEGGLHVFLNPGEAGGMFDDATETLGLDAEELQDAPGYFTAADFSGNGLSDLFYAAGDGWILFNDRDHFEISNLREAGGNQAPESRGNFAAPAAGPLWEHHRMGFVTAHEDGFAMVANVEGWPREISGYGNETSERPPNPLMILAEDLNADGTVDMLTVSGPGQGGLHFLNNRGYGSWMFSQKYTAGAKFFPNAVYDRGAGGIAAGDVTGNGALDLLVGGHDGTLSLLINDTLADREPRDNPLHHQRIRQNIRILTVDLKGPLGVTGAVVRLETADGAPQMIRQVNRNIGTGCRGPDQVNLAVRTHGEHVLSVQFADGNLVRRPVTLLPESPAHQILRVENSPSSDAP